MGSVALAVDVALGGVLWIVLVRGLALRASLLLKQSGHSRGGEMRTPAVAAV